MKNTLFKAFVAILRASFFIYCYEANHIICPSVSLHIHNIAYQGVS